MDAGNAKALGNHRRGPGTGHTKAGDDRTTRECEESFSPSGRNLREAQKRTVGHQGPSPEPGSRGQGSGVTIQRRRAQELRRGWSSPGVVDSTNRGLERARHPRFIPERRRCSGRRTTKSPPASLLNVQGGAISKRGDHLRNADASQRHFSSGPHACIMAISKRGVYLPAPVAGNDEKCSHRESPEGSPWSGSERLRPMLAGRPRFGC